MNINTNSWHYKFIDKRLNGVTAKNICEYMGQFIYAAMPSFDLEIWITRTLNVLALISMVFVGTVFLLNSLVGLATFITYLGKFAYSNLSLFDLLNLGDKSTLVLNFTPKDILTANGWAFFATGILFLVGIITIAVVAYFTLCKVVKLVRKMCVPVTFDNK